jgi:5-oxoprolinase (ATP-hydrolysing)
MNPIRIYVDRGGTFTDVVRVDGPRTTLEKLPSDSAVIGHLGGSRNQLTFGTTVATNALLERRGVPTLLIVTDGFEDLPLIRDMRRPALFDPDRDWPRPLHDRVLGLPQDPTAEDISKIEQSLSSIQAVAIALLGDDFAARERLLAAQLRELHPHLHIVESHRLSPDPGYLARLETALIDAAITPHLLRHLDSDHIPPTARAMRSDGTLVRALDLRAPDAILSGPAGGVLATLDTARRAGFRHAVGFDMGGTSTDICLVSVDDGPTVRDDDLEVAGVRLRRRMLEVETIAAGGGSILACEQHSQNPRLTVGPRSAGAEPGPQCYGRGGPPTLTDASLLAGLVDPSIFPFPLDPSCVDLPRSTPDQPLREAADHFLRVARETMAQAVTRLAMSRGVDLSDHALISYGGAGGQHAAPVAELLHIRTVLVHPAASVFCAYGQTLARRSETRRHPLWTTLSAAIPSLPTTLSALEASLPEDLTERRFELELAYIGSDYSLTIPLGDSLEARFHDAHEARFGFSRPLVIEARALLAHASEPPPSPLTLPKIPAWEALPPEGLVGPALLPGASTSIYVPPHWRARLMGGLLRLDHECDTAAPTSESPALAIALWQSRFQSIAEEAGVVLARLASSVSIKERLDFSCAVFDPEGRLVANAPHIPVHLGAMGETVADIARTHPTSETLDGDAWLTNDPAAGGSHLPDLTVVTAVHHEGTRFFVASRGHHVDVGGSTPGSMPSRSTTLSDEGFRLRRAPLVRAGALTDLRSLVSASRQPDTVCADLEAQLASNAHLSRRLKSLGPPDILLREMSRLHAYAAEATARFISNLSEEATAHDILDGIPLQLTLRKSDAHLDLDFTGTLGPHPGNLNAPFAVVRAAVLYALRLAVDTDALPMNDGTLAPVRLIVPPSVLLPPADAAVVGGNVETSQRIVDLVLKALALRAESAGTMNNLVLGGLTREGRAWAFYETLGGGYGATPHGPGRSARQVHMTNTRATDPEVLEKRLPLKVTRFEIRRGSGGDGLYRGGDGLIRELEVKTTATASLLAAWRPGNRGLSGGGDGASGKAELIRKGEPEAWDGSPVTLEPGDRVRVYTPGGGGFGIARNSNNLKID